jgi:hypothetical protein
MRWLLVLSALTIAGCGGRDRRLENLTVGISKDSAMAAMGVERPERIDPYLVGGRYIEILFYNRPGADSGSVPDRELSPLIVVDGSLRGWGWGTLDSVASVNRIVVEPK